MGLSCGECVQNQCVCNVGPVSKESTYPRRCAHCDSDSQKRSQRYTSNVRQSNNRKYQKQTMMSLSLSRLPDYLVKRDTQTNTKASADSGAPSSRYRAFLIARNHVLTYKVRGASDDNVPGRNLDCRSDRFTFCVDCKIQNIVRTA